jgi:hypothetical protein
MKAGRAACAVVYAVLFAVVISFFVPSHTKQSVDSSLYTIEIPLGLKIVELFDRDYHYRRLTKSITNDARTAEEKAKAIFRWTCDNIRTDFPKDWPVIDDHVWNSVVRGYGTAGQQAEVFTTLCAYAALPAAVYRAKAKGASDKITISVVEIEGKTYLFDTARRNIFLDRQGRMAALDDIMKDTSVAARASNRPVINGIPYEEYFKDLLPVERIGVARPDLQMPFKRLRFEFLKFIGLEKDIKPPYKPNSFPEDSRQ